MKKKKFRLYICIYNFIEIIEYIKNENFMHKICSSAWF